MKCRAYIAASRRSDRSLEARVESARRASEIHKKRTGRSLRVTEQDVVNEEMYEEEDDDLPMQYRRLTAHLQTESADFNRRLAAYLTNHVAMRSALDQAITNSYAQQYPNAPQFAHNQQTLYTSPLITHGLRNAPQHTQPSPQSGHLYRQSPYPMPNTPSFRQHLHHRSSSITSIPSVLPDRVGSLSISSLDIGNQSIGRRLSMPVSSTTPTAARAPLPTQLPLLNASPSEATCQRETEGTARPSPMGAPVVPQQQQKLSSRDPNDNPDLGPFTTALPRESQMLLGSALDPNDPLTSTLMAGSKAIKESVNHFDYTDVNYKQSRLHPSWDGMSATLAPSALDLSPSRSNYDTPSSVSTEPTVTSAYSYNFDGNFSDFKSTGYTASTQNGNISPGNDPSWDSFIDDNSWPENAT